MLSSAEIRVQMKIKFNFMVCISTTLSETSYGTLKLFQSITSRVGCVGKVLGPHTKKGFSRSIHFRMQMYTNVSKTSSRVSSTSDFDVFPARVTFFQLSLTVNLHKTNPTSTHPVRSMMAQPFGG